MILSGWKEIADYLHCGVRTVQRWERKGLPVRRPNAGKRSHVIARSEDLDCWTRTGGSATHEYPRIVASISSARRLYNENRVRMVELQQRVIRLRDEVAALRALRQRAVIAQAVSPPRVTNWQDKNG